MSALSVLCGGVFPVFPVWLMILLLAESSGDVSSPLFLNKAQISPLVVALVKIASSWGCYEISPFSKPVGLF